MKVACDKNYGIIRLLNTFTRFSFYRKFLNYVFSSITGGNLMKFYFHKVDEKTRRKKILTHVLTAMRNFRRDYLGTQKYSGDEFGIADDDNESM